MFLAHDLPGNLDRLQAVELGERQNVEPETVAGERRLGRKDEIAPGLDHGNAIFEKLAAIGRVAQPLLEVQRIADQLRDVEVAITENLPALLRHVGEKAQGLVRALGARLGHLLDLGRRRTQRHQMHAAETLQPLQELALLAQQATERDLLEAGDAHDVRASARLALAILERTTADISPSER